MSNLSQEVEKARLQVRTDAYPMSIGELVNLYEDNELDIHPEFQRIFRWTGSQKSNLIESILLGIPLPSIFVAQREDGVWDVIDGLQRISTILSLMGKLRNADGTLEPGLILEKTMYLPSLAGKQWDNPECKENELSIEIKRTFKREKIDIKIIQKESEGATKFELFQRLNTGGTRLSEQEVRNCLLLMLNKDAFDWLKNLSDNSDFIATTPVSEKKENESYRQELALRYIILRHKSAAVAREHTDIAPYLNAELSRLFSPDFHFDYEYEGNIFINVFKQLNDVLEENAFKKFNNLKQRYEGPVSVPVFEALTYYVSKLVTTQDPSISNKVQIFSLRLSKDEEFVEVLKDNTRPIDRMNKMTNIAERILNEDSK